jgi:site-specific recombinase XerD
MLGHAHLATTGIYLGCAVDQLCRDYRQALAASAPAGRP